MRPFGRHIRASSTSISSSRASFDSRRLFHATAPRRKDHHFDTLKFVQRLRDEGFTEEQSVAIMQVLHNVMEEG